MSERKIITTTAGIYPGTTCEGMRNIETAPSEREAPGSSYYDRMRKQAERVVAEYERTRDKEHAEEAPMAVVMASAFLKFTLAPSPEDTFRADALRYRWLKHYMPDRILGMFNDPSPGLDALIDAQLPQEHSE